MNLNSFEICFEASAVKASFLKNFTTLHFEDFTSGAFCNIVEHSSDAHFKSRKQK